MQRILFPYFEDDAIHKHHHFLKYEVYLPNILCIELHLFQVFDLSTAFHYPLKQHPVPGRYRYNFRKMQPFQSLFLPQMSLYREHDIKYWLLQEN